MDFNSVITSVLNGLFAGIGSTVGTWIVMHYFLKNIEKIEGKLKKETP